MSYSDEQNARQQETIRFLKRNPKWLLGILSDPDDIAREEAFVEWQRMLTDIGEAGA